MTPQPRGLAVPFSRALVRRTAVTLTGLAVVVGAPLVASALEDEPATATEPVPAAAAARAVDAAPVEGAPATLPRSLAPTIPELDADFDALSRREPSVDPVIHTLVAGYTWNQHGPRVVELQEALGVTADGWYSYATQQAHRRAFEYLDLPVDDLPAPVVPFGTEGHQWAALRDCESNGNYAIVNRSGKYRGAYQFDRSTWNSVAERHAFHLVGVDPAAASPGDQDAMAFALYGERGARPWPHCGRYLP